MQVVLFCGGIGRQMRGAEGTRPQADAAGRPWPVWCRGSATATELVATGIGFVVIHVAVAAVADLARQS